MNIHDLAAVRLDAVVNSTAATGETHAEGDPAKARLETWIRSVAFTHICQSSPELAVRLTPPNCRVPGYELLVREAVGRVKR